MSDEVDPEILYAAALGATLAQMRAELSDAAVERVLTFVLDRYAIDVPTISVFAMPAARSIVRETPPPAPDPPPAAMKPTTARPINQAHCPICEYAAMNEHGLTLHLYRKHGTTRKEIARQRALNGQ